MPKDLSFEELSKESIGSLKLIKEEKQRELADINKERHVLIANILSLQGLINDEISKGAKKGLNSA